MSCIDGVHHWSYANEETPLHAACDCGFMDFAGRIIMKEGIQMRDTVTGTLKCDQFSHLYYHTNQGQPCVCGQKRWPGIDLKQPGINRGEEFVTKDSGERQTFETGMVRDVQTNKPRYDLIWQPGLKRLAELMARGAAKYSERNWEKASTEEELNRFRASAYRHFLQWFNNETDEDHMSGTIFNLFGAEFVKEKLNAQNADRK